MPYDSYETRRRGYGTTSQRSTLGYWVPLAVTVTIATAGLVAWIWKERKDSEEYHDKPPRPSGGYNDQPAGKAPYNEGVPGQEPSRSYPDARYDGSRQQPEDLGVMSRVQDALRRTPSPQQIFDQASRRVTAGVAAAGAVVGNALSSIKEEKGDYEDHSRWSEEAIARPVDGKSTQANPSTAPDKRKIVAIVVSAEAKNIDTEDMGYSQAHAVSVPWLFLNSLMSFSPFFLIYRTI